ncbi:MAG: glycosyltransferase [Bacteroidales bacterium]|jgi:glycosyltransferase involved in cell wall biosynthesis|nr:glycosyltransferase [Bacteroidales bacterium]
MKLLSLAIACYNMEKHIPNCLTSLLTPETSGDLEIILVNDGSKDNSLKIMQEYKEKYPESIVIIDKANGHYGSCINAALDIATAKYFRPLDPDDYFDTKNLIYLLEKLKNTDVDMIITDRSFEFPKYSKKNNIKNYFHNVEAEKIYDYDSKYFVDTPLILKGIGMHNLTYKTPLLQEMNFKMTEGIYYVDREYEFYPLPNVKNFVFFDVVLYKYSLGISGQSMAIAQMIKNVENQYIIINKMLNYLKTNEINKVQENMLLAWIETYYNMTLCISKRNPVNEAKLKELDGFLLEVSPSLHQKTNNFKMLACFQYVKRWRQTGKYWGDTWLARVFYFVRNILKTCLYRLRGA